MTKTLTNSEGNWRDRPPTDFYPTPDNVTKALLNVLNLDTDTIIWEPACGEGHMVRTLENNGFKVVGTDIQSGTNFLQTTKLQGDWIITNPPFNIAENFIRHAHMLTPHGIALLLKSQYWHSAKRLKLFNEFTPSYVCPLSWRPDFLFGKKGGSPTMEVLWTIWMPDRKKTRYFPLPKPND